MSDPHGVDIVVTLSGPSIGKKQLAAAVEALRNKINAMGAPLGWKSRKHVGTKVKKIGKSADNQPLWEIKTEWWFIAVDAEDTPDTPTVAAVHWSGKGLH